MTQNKKIGTLAFLVRDGQVLLGLKKRGFAKDKWNGFGGKPIEGETVEDTMVREVVEECGVKPISYDHVGILEFANQVNDLWGVWVYMVPSWHGEPVETEEMKPQWFDFDKIPYEQMWPDDKEWLPRILKGEKIKGTFVLDNNVLKEFKIEML